jgi:hypothetical protein
VCVSKWSPRVLSSCRVTAPKQRHRSSVTEAASAGAAAGAPPPAGAAAGAGAAAARHLEVIRAAQRRLTLVVAASSRSEHPSQQQQKQKQQRRDWGSSSSGLPLWLDAYLVGNARACPTIRPPTRLPTRVRAQWSQRQALEADAVLDRAVTVGSARSGGSDRHTSDPQLVRARSLWPCASTCCATARA